MNPQSVLIVQVGKGAAITVGAPAAIGQGDPAAQGQILERGLGVARQRFGGKPAAAQRQLGGHNADETYFGAVVEYQGVAVDHLGHNAAAALRETGLGPRPALEQEPECECGQANSGPRKVYPWSAKEIHLGSAPDG